MRVRHLLLVTSSSDSCYQIDKASGTRAGPIDLMAWDTGIQDSESKIWPNEWVCECARKRCECQHTYEINTVMGSVL